jgi:hypothetical protein
VRHLYDVARISRDSQNGDAREYLRRGPSLAERTCWEAKLAWRQKQEKALPYLKLVIR